MIKQYTALEHTIGDKLFQLYVDPQSTLGELHDALSTMKAFVITKMQEIEKAAQAPQDAPSAAPLTPAEVQNDVAP